MKREYVPEFGCFVLIVEEKDHLSPDDAEDIMGLAWSLKAAQHNEDPDDPQSLVYIRFPGQDDMHICEGLIDLGNALFLYG